MEYIKILHILCTFLPYIIYTFVIVTFFPKSVQKIKEFAKINYEANLIKYHRCYSPDLCCHSLTEISKTKKYKHRKMVARTFEKYQQSDEENLKKQQKLVRTKAYLSSPIQVPTQVDQMTKKFENGNTLVNKNINQKISTSSPHKDIEKKEKIQNNLKCELIQENIENLQNMSIHSTHTNITQVSLKTFEISDENLSQPIPSTLYIKTTPSLTSSIGSLPKDSSFTSPVLRSPVLNMKSSLEDIFVTIACNVEENGVKVSNSNNGLTPVNSIEDILSQRRLSRPLSAYSISDLLLNEENSRLVMDEAHIENFLLALNKS